MARYGREGNYRRSMLEGGEGYNPHSRERDDFARLVKAEAARKAKYGRTSCPTCGQVYSVNLSTYEVEDHAAICRPLSADKILGM